MGFEPVDQQPDFPALEERILTAWREGDVFHRSLAAREGAPLFRFYEGPPTANGRPGVHHVEARVFKDLFPRYRTMKGYRVPRKAGWDCHGIPVELEVEKELGFTRKQDIEDYGVEAFNARCRASVERYVDDWNRLTQRIGFWVDLDQAYWTMSTPYVESVWWSLKRLWEAGLIYEGHRVVPYCPRCGTALSDHEVAQGYAEADDPSVYVRFPVLDGPLADAGASLLVWTTTPWTLISNTAVAVGEDIRYVLVDAGEHGSVVVAADLVDSALGPDVTIIRDVHLDELLGTHYEGPFSFVEPDEPTAWRYVTMGDFVTTADGTGLVHIAPAFGADDMAVARREGLPVVNPVDLEGKFDERVTPWAGVFVKDADDRITEDMRERGLLVKSSRYRHTYPFCWRCKTPLLYYAKPSWYIATTKIRQRLIDVNADVDWHPGHIREGRYGDWLANNVDWSLSRERYWGTPLPLWRCEQCHHVTCVGSREELGELSGQDHSDLDPHRPFVDDIRLPCPACDDGTAARVPEVIDAWYDSGSMPFAQFGYPHADGSGEVFNDHFPADFIAEAIDQTRGWFYSLMAVSTLLFDTNSYRTVLCLGHIVDAEGRKMSKSLGNILDPWELIGSRGADALRWLLLTDGSPWVARRVGPEPLDEVVRKFLLTLWNTYYFFVTYARIDDWSPTSPLPVSERPVMDRWILAELAELIRLIDTSLESFDATTAGRALTAFVDDLSNWYVRRSRRRFWAAEASPDKDAAFATLHTCLVELSALLAPFIPFTAEELHRNLVVGVNPTGPDSVHLRDFPTPDEEAVDDDLRAAMRTARRVVELGRRARNDARVGVRQPLRSALVTMPSSDRVRWSLVAPVVAEELNVKQIELLESSDDVVSYRLKPNFRALGPTFGQRTKEVAAAIAAADAAKVARDLATSGNASIAVADVEIRVTSDHVQVLEEARTGWQRASEGAISVALDLSMDDDLRVEGVARELVRGLNDLRKQQGLELADRVRVTAQVDGLAVDALERHGSWIAAEVLAVQLDIGRIPDGQRLELGDDAAAVVLLEVEP